jgi:hypothetical protein
MSLLLHVFDTATNQWVAATSDLLNSVKAVGYQKGVSASFTRPANTDAYAAQDVVSNSTTAPALLTFAGAARANGGSGVILSARHMKNSTGVGSYRLHLYTASTVAPINDNAPFTMLYANRASRVGFIDFNHVQAGAGSDSTNALTTFVNLPFVCGASASAIYGILTVTGAYTPTSGEQHFIELAVVQN